MRESIANKLEVLCERHTELAALMSAPDATDDMDRYQQLAKEYAQLEPVVDTTSRLQTAKTQVDDAKAMLAEDDAELRELAQGELNSATAQIEALEHELTLLLLPTDPRDEGNVYLEIRAGTGGDEAAIFAGDLFRMYQRYAEERKWQTDIVSSSLGEHGGYKEIIARIAGERVFSRLKFESGTHRVQRVPETESQGRIHTSACTVAVLAEVDEVEEVDLNPADLRIDTYRSSGAGGQHVNTTDSAIRITHLPTNTVVECQDERSQHKNKARAMSLLKARILEQQQAAQHAEQAADRKLQVGSGDRSERIRTYNYPQNRITDHRINLTLYQLEQVVSGDLDAVLEPLIAEHQADLLTELQASA